MVKPDIKGLKRYDPLKRLPAEVTEKRRSSKYDQVLSDAKRGAVKLVLKNDDRSTKVYVALRNRIKRDREDLEVKKRGLNVYVFTTASLKSARLSHPKITGSIKPAKMRS
jgi:hypothetical protein